MTHEIHPSLRRARKLATIMDAAFTIPIIRKKVGLDPILGLLPGGGDVIGLILSLYIVYVAIELELPSPILARMVLNIIIDTLVGSVPLLGDLFDAAWKANIRNLQLVENAHAQQLKNKVTVVDIQAEPV